MADLEWAYAANRLIEKVRIWLDSCSYEIQSLGPLRRIMASKTGSEYIAFLTGGK